MLRRSEISRLRARSRSTTILPVKRAQFDLPNVTASGVGLFGDQSRALRAGDRKRAIALPAQYALWPRPSAETVGSAAINQTSNMLGDTKAEIIQFVDFAAAQPNV